MAWMYQTSAITFDASFESGNLASAERTNEHEYDLFIQPDTQTITRMWFYFRVQNVPIGTPILFNIIGINKSNTTFSTHQRILVRSTTRTKWNRLPASQQYYINSSRHRCYSTYPVLSFAFQFDVQEEYFFAFGYPYTYSMLTRFISRVKDHNLPFVNIETLGQSLQGRDITCLTVGRPSVFARYHNDQKPQQMHTIMITARCHSGEFPGSYICHGILEFMLSNNPRAKFLRNNIQIKILPMINPDGVFSGFYRTNGAGVDLNRQYCDTSNNNESTIVRNLFEQLVGPERTESITSFDFSQLNQTLFQLACDNQIAAIQQIKEESDSENSTSQSQSRPRDNSSAGKINQQINQQNIKQQFKTNNQQLPPKQVTKQQPQQSNKLSYEQLIQQQQQVEQNQAPLHQTHLDFVLDLHSHSNQSGGFLFLNPDAYIFNKQKRYRTEQVFPQLLAKNCASFGSLQSSFKESQNTREGSLRRAFCQTGKLKLADDCPYIYCLEISNSHGPDPAEGGKHQLNIEQDMESSDADEEFETADSEQNIIIYTPEKYILIGEKICDTLYEIYSKLFK